MSDPTKHKSFCTQKLCHFTVLSLLIFSETFTSSLTKCVCFYLSILVFNNLLLSMNTLSMIFNIVMVTHYQCSYTNLFYTAFDDCQNVFKYFSSVDTFVLSHILTSVVDRSSCLCLLCLSVVFGWCGLDAVLPSLLSVFKAPDDDFTLFTSLRLMSTTANTGTNLSLTSLCIHIPFRFSSPPNGKIDFFHNPSHYGYLIKLQIR